MGLQTVRRRLEPALRRVFHLRFVRKDPGSRRDHVSFEPKNGFEDVIPDFERNSRFVILFSGRPSGEQVFIVDEKATVLEDWSRELLIDCCRNSYRRAAKRFVVCPVIQGIDA